DGSLLDSLCLAGEFGWARASSPADADAASLIAATTIVFFPRQDAPEWISAEGGGAAEAGLDDSARLVLGHLRDRGASFAADLSAACRLDFEATHRALGRLVAAGLVTSDGFGGLRSLLRGTHAGRSRAVEPGRWAIIRDFTTGAGELDVVAR